MIFQTQSLKLHNEDAIGHADGLWILLDGASGLGQKDLKKTGSDAAWFSHAAAFELLKASDKDGPLDVLVQEAAASLAAQFPPSSDIDQPSATLCLVRIRENLLEYFILGDSSLILQTNSQVLELTDPSVSLLDDLVIERMKEIAAKQGLPFLQTRPLVQDLLIAHRHLKNKPEGYPILDLKGLWKGRALTGSFPLKDVVRFAMMSDGFRQLAEFMELSPEAFLDYIEEHQEACFAKLDAFWEEDSQCIKVPRLSKRDDASLIFMTRADF